MLLLLLLLLLVVATVFAAVFDVCAAAVAAVDVFFCMLVNQCKIKCKQCKCKK